MHRITLLFILLMTVPGIFARSVDKSPYPETDTITSEPIIFTVSSASEYISHLLEMDRLWRPGRDTMKISLARMIGHYKEPFDSVENRLRKFEYDSVKFRHSYIIKNDTIPLRWLNDSTLIVDTVKLKKEPIFVQKTIIKKIIDSTGYFFDHMYDMEPQKEFVHQTTDTITEMVIDTFLLESKKIQMHKIVGKRVVPPFLPAGSKKSARFMPDYNKIVISDSIQVIVASDESPFYVVPNERISDSLRFAVETLLSYTYNRDSILLFINNIEGKKTPFWLTTGDEDLVRYWVKNYRNDSITIWIGNPSKKEITLVLEEDINVNRLQKEIADDIPITQLRPQRALTKVEPLKAIPVYWKYGVSSLLSLNQTYLSNWAKGGENSLSSMLDITGTAKYTNVEKKNHWTNSARLKYGNIITQEYGTRTTTDLLEMNSQYNRVILEKIDFSSVFYMKTQIAKGYKYPNDSVVVSRFLNPGTFTIGVGLEYKPSKSTQLNFSMLSYKNTFVLDTAGIDQTKHGVPKDKRAKQEMGGQLLVKSKMSILDGLNMSNTIRLFSGYLNKPENIDVDWEMNLEKRINWYFTIMLNFHIIYDDDIRFPVLDKDKQPVLRPDGTKKTSPKMQFKQYLGLTFSFKF